MSATFFSADLPGLCVAAALTLFLATRQPSLRPAAAATGESAGPAPLAIVSCDELIAAGTAGSASYGLAGADEHHLYAALRARGIPFHVRAWSDASVEWGHYKLILNRTAWDYSASEARAYAFTQWLTAAARGGAVLLNDARVQTWNVHKSYLAELVGVSRALPRARGALELATVPSEFVPAGARVDLPALLARAGWSGIDIILKPCVGGGSRACHVLRVREAGAVARAQDFLDAHVLGGGVDGDARVAHAALVAGPHAAAAHEHAAAHATPSAAGIASTLSHAATPAAAHAALAARALGASAARPAGGDFTQWSLTAAATPCDMLVQPFFETVAEGELSVFFIDSKLAHAVRKRPRAGEFRCQEEYGGVATVTALPPAVAALAERAFAAARVAVETRTPPSETPTSPGAAELEMNAEMPRLPANALFVCRFDFLPATPALIARAFTGPRAGSSAPDPTTPWLLLEAELIEPALFFKEAAASGVDAAGQLADALAQQLALAAR
jgi:hypothetical protein